MDAETLCYFFNYKKNLNNFISQESGNLTIQNYMRLVREVKRTEQYMDRFKVIIKK